MTRVLSSNCSVKPDKHYEDFQCDRETNLSRGETKIEEAGGRELSV
jgi:hypothetical protein